ncbi:hypothetical protein AHMF7616_01189 [Adhaeribacter pallidiroseus]|uniref:Uncharacterized protein n=1 Tax=Adhaeribacter pallidiroseus TaxID=2072847 RepID=A0A369QGC5_9BACT|nr:hypothetical protein AHMF7616_01189 [Adhaeribacter pallidiroseus]
MCMNEILKKDQDLGRDSRDNSRNNLMQNRNISAASTIWVQI